MILKGKECWIWRNNREVLENSGNFFKGEISGFGKSFGIWRKQSSFVRANPGF